MDLKKLIAKMDQIESKKVLTESEDKEATWTDMKGKPAKGKNKKYGNQSKPTEVDSEGKEKKKVEEGLRIAKALLEVFGLPEAVAGNPWAGSDPAKAAAWAALTPEDQQWLGGADPTDQNILARAPNKGAKINTAADQADADMGAAMKASAAQAAQPTSLDPFAGVDPNAIKAANASAQKAPQQAAKPAAKPDPKVQALQQQLIKAGANIKADGIMGPKTQAAMKQFPQAASTTATPTAAIGAQAALRKADTAAATLANTGAQAALRKADTAAAPATKPAAGPQPIPTAELQQAVPNPQQGQEYWVKGSRYIYNGQKWTQNLAPTDKLMWNVNRKLAQQGYTGPVKEGIDELRRLAGL